jgi:hypothetical protein
MVNVVLDSRRQYLELSILELEASEVSQCGDLFPDIFTESIAVLLIEL